MKRKETSDKKTERTRSVRITALKLSQAKGKELGEMLLNKAKDGDVYLLITSDSKGTETPTATILAIPASETENWGFDTGSSIDVGEIGY